MAYKKRRAYKKKGGPFKRAAKFAYKHAGKADKALKIAMKLKDMVNIEYKEYEALIQYKKIGNGTNVPAVSDSIQALALCQPAQGTTSGTRVGDSIKLQRLSGRGHIAWVNQAAPPGGTLTAAIRVILFRGKADNNRTYYTNIAPDPMFDQIGVLGAKTENQKYLTKFLFDRTYQLDVTRTNKINLNWNFPLNWHQNFRTGVTGIEDAGLYLIVVTDTGIIPACEFIMNYSVSYTDD